MRHMLILFKVPLEFENLIEYYDIFEAPISLDFDHIISHKRKWFNHDNTWELPIIKQRKLLWKYFEKHIYPRFWEISYNTKWKTKLFELQRVSKATFTPYHPKLEISKILYIILLKHCMASPYAIIHFFIREYMTVL